MYANCRRFGTFNSYSHFDSKIFNNYLPKAKWLLVNIINFKVESSKFKIILQTSKLCCLVPYVPVEWL